MGRPSEYKPEFCDLVITCGEQGDSAAQMAAKCGVIRATLRDWATQFPEFSTAFARARELSMAWWETQGRKGIWAGKEFNAQAWSRSMAARFPDDYREKPDVSVTVNNVTADAAITKARGKLGK